jgi:hypothetical protein
MLFVPGELTKRSPFGAYAIIRGERRSANVVTVNPFVAFGIMPSGLPTDRLGFGLAAAGEGSASARGCGTMVFCCAAMTDVASAIAATPVNVLTMHVMHLLPRLWPRVERRTENEERRTKNANHEREP